MTRTLALLAFASTLLLAPAAGASPFEWYVVVLHASGPSVITEAEFGADPYRGRPYRGRNARARSGLAGASLMPIALHDGMVRDHWAVRPTAVFAPASGATTFLEQLIPPASRGTSPVANPTDAGFLQPLPPFETASRRLPEPPDFRRTTVRYRGEAAAMLPLGMGFLGLVVGGRKPRPLRPVG